MACQGVPACRIAVSNPGEDLSQMINKLQSSVVTWEKENANQTYTTFFTDRRYHRGQSNDRNRDGNNRNYSRNRTYKQSNSGSKGRCYVCQKEDCRSWKHTHEERTKAKETYKSKFDNHFKERLKQYIIDCEGDEDSEDLEDLNKAFEALIIDIESKPNHLNTSTKEDTTTSYLTTFGELTPNEATSISTVLSNKAFSHSLTLEDITKDTLATDPFTYTLNTSGS